jgi:hypothetical protein
MSFEVLSFFSHNGRNSRLSGAPFSQQPQRSALSSSSSSNPQPQPQPQSETDGEDLVYFSEDEEAQIELRGGYNGEREEELENEEGEWEEEFEDLNGPFQTREDLLQHIQILDPSTRDSDLPPVLHARTTNSSSTSRVPVVAPVPSQPAPPLSPAPAATQFPPEPTVEDEEEDEDGLLYQGPNAPPSVPELVTVGTGRNQFNLPPIPDNFIPFEHPTPQHVRKATLPESFREELRTASKDPTIDNARRQDIFNSSRKNRCNAACPEGDHEHQPSFQPDIEIPEDTPLRFFSLFFDQEVVLPMLAQNTNDYAKHHGPGGPGMQRWKYTTVARLMVFLGLIIYMGVFRSAQVTDYWSNDPRMPIRNIARGKMGPKEFEQLKPYFHVSVPYTSLSQKDWMKKLEPLSTILQEHFKRYMLIASMTSIDEEMIRFVGRLPYTPIIKGKLIPKGYKTIALCERGYTWDFVFTSRVDSFTGLHPVHMFGLHLSATSQGLLQMCLSLPYEQYQFVFFCDNYFSNIPLFHVLRRYKISACRTTRLGSANYPPIFMKIGKKKHLLPHNTLSGVICSEEEDQVLVFIWQDKDFVRFMTTAYDGNMDNTNNVEMVMQRRPRITPQNRSIVMSTWGLLVRKWLALPKATVHYNVHMNGVDINDQLRSYYSTQLRTVQNWMPLFFWLSDMAIINAFLICHEVYPDSHIKWIKNHRWFRIQLAHNLVNAGAKSTNPQWFGVYQNEVNPRSKGRYGPGATPQGNSTESHTHGYVGKDMSFRLGEKLADHTD